MMVRALMETLIAGVTLWALAIAAIIAGALGLLTRFVVSPLYHSVTGFLPFDAQFPLSKIMIAVELGAFDKAAAMAPYTLFAAVDLAYVIATAALVTMGWMWLLAKFPMALFAFLRRGGIAMMPAYVVILDIIAKVGFFRLIGGLSGEDYARAVEFYATVHRLKFALLDIRNYLTIGFLLAIILGMFFARTARARP